MCGEENGSRNWPARQWIPAEDISDPVKSLVTGLPVDLRFPPVRDSWPSTLLTDAYADGLAFDFGLRRRGLRQLPPHCGSFLEEYGQGLRAGAFASTFMITPHR